MGSRSFYATFYTRNRLCYTRNRLCFTRKCVWVSALASALALLVALVAPETQASTSQSLDDLQKQVHRYLESHYRELSPAKLEIQVSNLDPRLQLALCTRPLSFRHSDTNNTGGNLSVHTRCEGEQPWALYLPAQVSLYRSLPVASRQLERGSLLTKSDIDMQVVNISQLRQGVVTSIDSLVGMEVKRPLAQGDAFRSAAIEAPLMVRRGESVSIELQAGAISVTTGGTAMANGRQGDRIRVRNSQSDRIVTAEVIASGRVRTAI